MRILKANKSTKYKVTLALAILVLAIGVSVALWIVRNDGGTTSIDDGIEVTPAPKSLSEEDAANKKAFIDSQEKGSNSDTTTQEGASSDQQNSDITLEVQQNQDEVVISTQLQNIGDGICTLEITKADKAYSDTAEVIYQPRYSSCAGFSVPVSELGKGTWVVSVSATSLSNNSAKSSTSLEVK